MKVNPLVSILIPLYNAEKYFSKTMESLLAQRYKNIEIIIVDDGSTDNSLNIALKYEKSYKNINVYTQKNSGAPVVRNKAFEMSKGEYIQYFDADDILHPDKILSQIEILKPYGFQDDIVATGKGTMFWESIEKSIFTKQVIYKNYDDKFLFFKDSWENRETIMGQSWLIPRKINEKAGDWDVQLLISQDQEFFTRVVYHAQKIIFAKESLVYYRKGNPNSISSNTSLMAIRSRLDACYSYERLLNKNINKHSLKKGIATLYSGIYATYFPLDKKIKEEVLNKLRYFGYEEPLIEFKPSSLWIVKILGVNTGLKLRNIKHKIMVILGVRYN